MLQTLTFLLCIARSLYHILSPLKITDNKYSYDSNYRTVVINSKYFFLIQIVTTSSLHKSSTHHHLENSHFVRLRAISITVNNE